MITGVSVIGLCPFAHLEDAGQSILEILFVLPVLLGLTMFLIRTNTAIQMAIVDQQYARSQTLYISGNGAEYPRRSGIIKDLAQLGFNQIAVGVSEEYIESTDSEGDGSDTGGSVNASTQYIARKPNQGNNDPQTEPDKRGRIRIRNTVTLCIPAIVVGGRPLLLAAGGSAGAEVNAMGNDPRQFNFCATPMEYLP